MKPRRIRSFDMATWILICGFVHAGSGSFSEDISIPMVDFRSSTRTTLIGTPVVFTDQSYVGTLPVAGWRWDFGDQQSSTEVNPVHAYSKPGRYGVRLTLGLSHGEFFSEKKDYVQVLEELPAASDEPDTGTPERLRLTPEERGSFIRISHPSNPEACITLWAPESISWPPKVVGANEFSDGPIHWQLDQETGVLQYDITCPEGLIRARFVPHADHVECFYASSCTPGVPHPAGIDVQACQKLVGGVFEGGHDDLMSRVHFLSGGEWVALGKCPDAGIRSLIALKEQIPPQEIEGCATRSIRTRQADEPLIACVSRDGQWVTATASESRGLLFHNALPGYRCIHSFAFGTFDDSASVTVRLNVYLIQGTLNDIRRCYLRDKSAWSRPAAE